MKRWIPITFAWWLVSGRIPADAGTAQLEPGGDYVVLLHGLRQSPISMKRLEWHLARQGYRIINVGYPSTRFSVGQLADQHLAKALAERITDHSVKVHFVTHSLGGIILRQYLSNHSVENLGRVVMLAPPNHGSEIADRLDGHWFGRWLLGKSGRQLGTGADDLPHLLGPARFKLGVVAGDRSLNPCFSRIIPGPDDGEVSVQSARQEGMEDFVIVHRSHTWIIWARETRHQVDHFLSRGRFDQP